MRANFEKRRCVISVSTGRIEAASFSRVRSAWKISDLASCPLATAGPEGLRPALESLLARIKYSRQPVILLIPAASATSRFVRIPAVDEREMENILSLQAHRFLPASLGDLITGFQVISRKGGFSEVNLVIVPSEAVERFISAVEPFSPESVTVTVNSLALFNFFSSRAELTPEPVYLAGMGKDSVECAIASSKGIFVSRSFSLEAGSEGKIMADELRGLGDAYRREIGGQPPSKAFVTGIVPDAKKIKETSFGMDALYIDPIKDLPPELAAKASKEADCLAALLGAGTRDIPGSLNLIDPARKNSLRSRKERRQVVHSVILAVSALAMLTFSSLVSLQHKKSALEGMSRELRAAEKEAGEIEEFEALSAYAAPGAAGYPGALDIFHETFSLLPAELLLESFSYDTEAGEVVYKGRAGQLNDVFTLMSNIERGQALKGFTPRINYASESREREGISVAFEVRCVRSRKY